MIQGELVRLGPAQSSLDHREVGAQASPRSPVRYRPVVDEPVVCARCGRTQPSRPPTWTLQTDRDERSWLCETCTREHLRSIEGKLDESWW